MKSLQPEPTIGIDNMPLNSAPQEPDAEERELELMPRGYRRRVTPEQRARHLGLIASHPGYPYKTFVKHPLSCTLDPIGGRYRLTTYSLNSPRSLQHVTAAIALHHGSIEEAHLFPRSDGTLLIEVAFRGLSPDLHFGGLRETLAEMFDFEARSTRTPECDPIKDVEITYRPKLEDGQTVIEIRAADAKGLLYRISRAFALLGIKIYRAEIETRAGRAYDVFFVTDRLGRPLDMERELPFLRREILTNSF